jgi:hypothetical protein
MSYKVVTFNKGAKFWLRGTTWAFDADRANTFATEEAAAAALAVAAKFAAPAIIRAARFEQVQS